MPADMIIIQAAGSDAGSFLQGQLSCDIRLVERGEWCLGAYCTPEGRVLMLLWVLPAPEGFWLAMPRDLSVDFLQRIRRYILRSAVTFTETSLQFGALPGPNPEKHRIIYQDDKWFSLGGIAGMRPVIGTDITHSISPAAFRAACIRAGIAAICAQHSGRYLPQMLNLQAYAGLSFNKGCYLGQEGIARNEYKAALHRHLAYAETTETKHDYGIALQTENTTPAGSILACGTDDAGSVVQAIVNDRYLDKPLITVDNRIPLTFHSYH